LGFGYHTGPMIFDFGLVLKMVSGFIQCKV
jgi:hypothetical protein